MRKIYGLAAGICLQLVAMQYAQAQTHFNNCVSGTGDNATILVNQDINPSIDGTGLASGDEIAVYTSDGICAGVEVWTDSNIALTVWGDNSLTTEKDGLSAGEQMHYVVWDASSQTEYGDGYGTVTVAYVSDPPYNGTGLYDQDAIYQPSSLAAVSPLDPDAVISATPVSGIAPLDVSFDGSASFDEDGSIASFAWDFGDGSTATGSTTQHTYTTAGSYTATLTVTDNDGRTDAATQNITVDTPPVNNPPTASFSATPTSGTVPVTITVDASASSDSDGSIVSYSWVFGDGGTASGQTTSHQYTEPGSYEIQLTITDDDGATAISTETVTVSSPTNAPPTASFSASPTSGDAPLTVTVDGSASNDTDGSIDTYAWDFGNGSTASGQNASTVYSSGGTYTIRLTVTDDDGATGTSTTTINVGTPPGNQAPQAAFSATPASGMAPLAVTFDATASSDADGNITSYAWDFGDGSTASGVNANHTYSAAGNYTAVLVVTDDDGATASVQQQISATSPTNQAPSASFTADPVSGSVPLTVQFDASGSTDSDGTITTYAWDFGGGQTAAGSTASYTFTTGGTYAVTLVVTDDDGAQDTATTTITASDDPAGGELVLHFSFDETSGSIASDQSGNSNSGSLLNGAQFSSSDGRVGGAVRLDGQDAYVDVEDHSKLNQSIVTQRTIAFWFNSDDVAVSSRKQVLFEEGGQQKGLSIYLFDGTLYAGGWNKPADESGWSGTFLSSTAVTSTEWHHVAVVLDGGPTVTPEAFTLYVDGTPAGTGDGSQLWTHFDDIGIGRVDGDTWFHDNTSKEGQNHGFGGLIDELRIYNYDLSASEVVTLASVGSGTNQLPTARIETDRDTGEAPLLINFDGATSSDADGQIVSYSWDFGDGSTASGTAVGKTFSQAGNYTVTLNVTDNSGASGNASKVVVVTPGSTTGSPPFAEITEDQNRRSTMSIAVDATESYDSDGPIQSYTWDFGDGSTTTGESVSHEYTSPGSYKVVLTVIDGDGLSATDELWTTAHLQLPESSTTSVVGAVGHFDPGYADYTGDVLAIRAPASPSSAESDVFRFVYNDIAGDASITGRVESNNGPAGAQVGLMLRSHLTPGATAAEISVASDGKITLYGRGVAGLGKEMIGEAGTSLPAWLRLTRQGHAFRGYWSDDGTVWHLLGTIEIGMAERIFMGVAAYSTAGSTFNARVDNLDFESRDQELPDGFSLSDAYPNPFNPSSLVTLVLEEAQTVVVDVYNVAGERVQEIFRGEVLAHDLKEFRFVAADHLASGMYFFRLTGESFAATRPVMLVK